MRPTAWGVAACVLLALFGCAPPSELAGREPTPDDVQATSLLPPGRVADLVLADGHGAETTTEAGGRFVAVQFATVTDADRMLGKMWDEWRRRPGIQSTTSVDAPGVRHARYTSVDRSGLMWVSGRWLFVAEAADPGALAALIASSRAGGLETPGFLGSAAGLTVVFAGALGALLLAIGLLLRAVLRAIAVRPAPGVSAIATVELVRRLTALNAPGLPWLVRRGPEADLVVEWKYADATWWGLLAKSGVRKAYRLRLYFDEAAHRCGALDEFGEVDWSAGLLAAPRIHYSRTFFRGVQLVRKEGGVAYGFKTPTGGLAKVLDYKFDIDELKQPVIDTVTASGWTYQPILWPQRTQAKVTRSTT